MSPDMVAGLLDEVVEGGHGGPDALWRLVAARPELAEALVPVVAAAIAGGDLYPGAGGVLEEIIAAQRSGMPVIVRAGYLNGHVEAVVAGASPN